MTPDPFAGWTLAPAAPVDVTGWSHVPAGADWVQQRKAALNAVDERLAERADKEGNKPPDPGLVSAIGHGLQSGLSVGFQPKIEAGLSKAFSAIDQSDLVRGLNRIGRPDAQDSAPADYMAELAKARAVDEASKKHHPWAHGIADFVGSLPAYSTGINPILASGILGAGRSAGESENIAGEKGTNLRGAAEVAGGGAAGAATAWLLPKVLGGMAGRYGRKADEAATDAVTFGTQTARDKFNRAMDPVRAMAPGGQFVPGEVATTLNELGAVGGFRGQRGTLKGIQEAKKTLGEKFGSIINDAASKDPGVPIESAKAALGRTLEENQANSLIEREVAKAGDRLDKVVKDGFVPHNALQDVLANMNKSASKIFPKVQKSEGEDAFLSAYRALRDVQAEGLETATGHNANDLRKYMAMTYGLEPVAQKAVNRFEGNDRVGLLGALEKQKGSTSMGHGILAFAMGQPVLGAGMVLKGALNVAKGQFGKSSSPLRNNIATSINLGLQKPLHELSQSELAQLLGARLAAEGGALGGGMAYDKLNPPGAAPEAEPAPPEVAQTVLPQATKKKKRP